MYVAESIDNESVNSGRAALYYKSFVDALSVSIQSRVLTDTESGGLSEEDVE